jgi:signal transduction histidine kinase
MHRLYLRIYFAVLASLAAFALSVGIAWHFVVDHDRHQQAARLVQNVLPRADAPAAEQQAALERAARDVPIDLTLFDLAGRPVASVGAALPAPRRSGWHSGGMWAVRLADGRWLAARAEHGRFAPAGLVALAVLLVAVGVGAYPVVRRLTRRLERLQASVEALGAGQLSARVKVEGDDEVSRLAESFNRAAARIEALVAAHKGLLANASHELRTPLARIRMALELPERRAEAQRDIAELDALIDEMLLASRLDAGGALEDETVDLLALAAEEASRYGVEVEGHPVNVKGEPRLLRRLIRNLLENAQRHGAPPVAVLVEKSPHGGAELRVRDAGPGIPEPERERVFEPFYRRARGSGLGLSIVRQIARRHGGEARCEPGGFVVTLRAAGSA